jgi:Holliday junction resolvasome RuvABC endonuclease subunit
MTDGRRFVTLAFDLAWAGPSGAALLTLTRQGDAPVTGAMRILPPHEPPTYQRKDETDGAYHARQAQALHAWIAGLALHFAPDLIAVEVSDWHQPGTRRAMGRERVVQRALGRAEGVAALTAILLQRRLPHLQYVEMGATEVKKLVARRANAPKADVARAVCRTYSLPRPKRGQDLDGYDAAALAHAAAVTFLPRAHQETLS